MKVLIQLLKEFGFPLLAALLWATYNVQPITCTSRRLHPRGDRGARRRAVVLPKRDGGSRRCAGLDGLVDGGDVHEVQGSFVPCLQDVLDQEAVSEVVDRCLVRSRVARDLPVHGATLAQRCGRKTHTDR